MTEPEKKILEYSWEFWGRPDQQEPTGNWSTWLALCGRGWGKTEAGAHWIRRRVANGARMLAIVAETQKDLEEVMVPRIIAVHPPELAPTARYKPVKLTWPNGAVAWGYNGTEPKQLRGPEFDTAWVDELAKYRQAQDLWDMLQFTMRRSQHPRVLVTTTPRPLPIIRKMIEDSHKASGRVKLTRGSMMDNAANLPKTFVEGILEKYEGTRLGRQEINAELLEEVPGALWTREILEKARAPVTPVDMKRIVVAVDPSGARGEDDEGADSQGIVVAGLGVDGRGYILADRSCKMSPDGWARRAVSAYKEFKADRLVAERNFGGAMVEATIRMADKKISYKEVVASRGKAVRAEPVAALYEQGRISHVNWATGAAPERAPDHLDKLEDQMCQMRPDGYVGDGSPDRLDAAVWALSELMVEPRKYDGSLSWV